MWHNWPMYAGLPEAEGALAEIDDFLTRVASPSSADLDASAGLV
jgi:hypothetical protein